MSISRYRKAIVSALAAGAGALVTAAQDNQITGSEWWAAGVVTLAALGFTGAIPNKPTPTAPKEPTV